MLPLLNGECERCEITDGVRARMREALHDIARAVFTTDPMKSRSQLDVSLVLTALFIARYADEVDFAGND